MNWIPTSKELPPFGKFVLAYGPLIGMFVAYRRRNSEHLTRSEWYLEDGGDYSADTHEVTHWTRIDPPDLKAVNEIE